MIKLEEIQALESGQFVLDCPRIRIKAQNKKRSEMYEGPGFIRQTKDSEFKFKVYNRRKVKSVIFPSVVETGKEGDIITEEDYYKITAYDYSKRRWISKTIHLNINEYGFEPKMNVLLHGNLDELTCKENSEGKNLGDYVRLTLFNVKEFPFTEYKKEKTESDNEIVGLKHREIVDYSDLNFKVFAKKTNSLIDLKITPLKKKIHTNSYKRAIESLNFILGRLSNPSLIRINKKNQLTTIISYQYLKHSYIEPPLQFRSYPDNKSKAVWSIFSNYLREIWSFKEKVYSSLGEETNLVIESGSSSFSVQCLIVSVCIEALLKKFYKPKLSKYFNPEEEITAKKMLKLLIEKKLITKNQSDMWDALRNKEAHGERESKKWFQKQLWRYDEVLELFYRLIFNHIKYSGTFTQYGKGKYGNDIFKTVLL
ncbi:MAG: hypothetical protein KAX28_01740 [Candidatus Marinimicrobia bacterium]|nr:hypothetical protein [Candidatus Neomarinimicrobiota bacterium]